MKWESKRFFFHLNRLLRITTVIPNHRLGPATSAYPPLEEVSPFRHSKKLTENFKRMLGLLNVKAIAWYHSCVCQEDILECGRSVLYTYCYCSLRSFLRKKKKKQFVSSWFPEFLSDGKTSICSCILFLSFHSVWPHIAWAFLLSLPTS